MKNIKRIIVYVLFTGQELHILQQEARRTLRSAYALGTFDNLK